MQEYIQTQYKSGTAGRLRLIYFVVELVSNVSHTNVIVMKKKMSKKINLLIDKRRISIKYFKDNK